jgi:hypothetical protein
MTISVTFLPRLQINIVQDVELLTCSRKVAGSNLSRDTAYHIWGFYWLPSAFLQKFSNSTCCWLGISIYTHREQSNLSEDTWICLPFFWTHVGNPGSCITVWIFAFNKLPIYVPSWKVSTECETNNLGFRMNCHLKWGNLLHLSLLTNWHSALQGQIGQLCNALFKNETKKKNSNVFCLPIFSQGLTKAAP